MIISSHASEHTCRVKRNCIDSYASQQILRRLNHRVFPKKNFSFHRMWQYSKKEKFNLITTKIKTMATLPGLEKQWNKAERVSKLERFQV